MSRLRHLGGILTLSTFLLALPLSGQAPDARFDAADVYVRPHPVGGIPSMTAPMLRAGRYDFRSATLLDLIKTAYGIEKERILGGPSWLDWNRFDIVAKAPASTPPAAIAVMLKSLLAERFQLVAHTETRPVSGYALLSAGRPSMTMSSTDGDGACTALPNVVTGTLVMSGVACKGMTMEAFAASLRARAGAYLDGDVIDATALKGRWDFELRWTPKLLLARAGNDGVAFDVALERQLGLKLEPRTFNAPVLLVESAKETPAPNPSGTARDLPAPPPAEFDVADIKIAAPDAPTAGRLQAGGRVDLQGMTMKTLIRLAWSLNDDALLAGGPKWLDDTKYSVVARSTSAIGGTAANLQIDIDDLRLMLRALLIQRFALKTHLEDRPVSAYTLVADKPKLRPADPAHRTNCREGVDAGVRDPRLTNPLLSRLVTCQNMTLRQFAEDLPRIAGGYIRMAVADESGLDGAWDFTLNFSPNGQAATPAPGAGSAPVGTAVPMASDPTGTLSVFDAMERQLGLKLELRKRPMPVLVIDHVEERPSDN